MDRPSAAGVYDYLLGGTSNGLADRLAAEEVLKVQPDARRMPQANRAFLGRVVEHLANDVGLRQFLDIGSGIPVSGTAFRNVHEIAQEASPDARVVYVDNDVAVLNQAWALLAGDSSRTRFLYGDVRDPEGVLSNEAMSLLDWSEPVGVLFAAVLHFVHDADRPSELVEAFLERAVAGSCLVISHATDDYAPKELLDSLERTYGDAPSPLHLRSHMDILELFRGRRLTEPGLVRVSEWRCEEQLPPSGLELYGGVCEIA